MWLVQLIFKKKCKNKNNYIIIIVLRDDLKNHVLRLRPARDEKGVDVAAENGEWKCV